MADPAVLDAVAELCEREESSRELDEALALVSGWTHSTTTPIHWWLPPANGEWVMSVPRFTSNWHAARSLSNWSIHTASEIGDGHPLVVLTNGTHSVQASGGRTLELTLCAASLRALAVDARELATRP